jgi:outer membrane protein assembly factor BamE (lipoprotein component of BamABCDE complex)
MNFHASSRAVSFHFALCMILVCAGCATAPPPAEPPAKQLTVGVVQKEIHNGMSQPDVAAALGSPNIVTKDSDGFETWIYDKIGTEARLESREGYGTVLLLGGGSSTTVSSTSQRTLTVIIKFDKSGNVSTFTYHASKF